MNTSISNAELPPLSRLIVAVKLSDTVALRRVLTSNPELLNYRDEKGATPLHWAAKWQSLPVVDVLMELGADTTVKDTLGYTAEGVAYWNGEFANGAYTDTCKHIVKRLKEINRHA